MYKLHEIFVNTAVHDGTDIGELMDFFKKSDFYSSKFPKLSAEVRRLKTTEGGVQSMCKIMEEMFATEKARLEAEKEQLEAEKAEVVAEKEKAEAEVAEKNAEIERLKAQLAQRENH